MNARALINYLWLTAELFVVGALGMLAVLTMGTAVALVISLLLSEARAESAVDKVGDNRVDSYVVNPNLILSVYDGDTFYIKVPECAELVPSLCARLGVRVNGVDTPEMHGKCDSERLRALEARNFTAGKLLAARSVVLHHVEREKFGRLLADVEVDGVDLGRALIAGGFARAYHGEARTLGWCEGSGSSLSTVSVGVK